MKSILKSQSQSREGGAQQHRKLAYTRGSIPPLHVFRNLYNSYYVSYYKCMDLGPCLSPTLFISLL